MPRNCLLFVFLSVIAAGTSNKLSPIQPLNGTQTEAADLPPLTFPLVPNGDGGSEVYDLLNVTVKPIPNPDSETVDHPKIHDPGTTHQEGGMPSQNKTNESSKLNDTNINLTKDERSTLNATTTNSTEEKQEDTKSNSTVDKEESGTITTTPKPGVIYICNFPKSWLKQLTGKSNGSSPGLDNSENETDTCTFPRDWFKESSTFHICTIHKEWLRSKNYTIENGTIPAELLEHMNTTSNFSCVTPSDAVSDDYDNSTNYSTVPQAWIRKGNDIYIYLIPEDNSTNITATESVIASKLDENSAEESANVSSSTTTSKPELARVPLTPDVTNVKLVNSNSDTENSTVLVNNSSSPNTVESTEKDVSVNTTAEAEIVPKLNTPTQEGMNNNQTDAEKSTTNEDDKNKTVQDQNKLAETSTPDVAENVIDSESTTPSSPAALLQKHAEHDHSSSSGKTAFLQPTESAAILAGVFVAIALLGYVGLLVWRRILERRYGNREMLVNEDDDFDTSDMRHFEMQNTRSSSVIQFK